MRVSVIVPALNAAATIGETLEALRHQELEEPYEVIVVDDGSTDDTVEIAERFLAPSAVIRQRRLGAAAARNRGTSAARGSVLAFTDADCAPVPQWLAAGLAAIGHVDLVQGAVRATPGERIGPFDRSLWVDRESGFYESANLFVRRELFDQLGGFESWLDPKLGRPLGEDAWLVGGLVAPERGRASRLPRASITPSFGGRCASTPESGAGCATSPEWRRGCPSSAGIRSSLAAF